MATEYQGATVGPSSKFYVFVQYENRAQDDDGCQIWWRRGLYVKPGSSFGGTLVTTSWGGQVNLYGEGVYCDTGWQNSGWKSYGTRVSTYARAYYTGSSGAYYNSELSAGWTNTAPTWTPYAPTGASVTRNSDNKNTIKWTNNTKPARPYANIVVKRSVDGGSWSTIDTISRSSTSYSDTTTSENHSYQYRVAGKNSAGTSSYVSTDTVYNTPCAPVFNSVSRKEETTITAVLTNNANTATALEVERSNDKETWVSVGTFDGKVTTFDDTPGGGTFWYRARNTRDDLVSDWVYSESVVTICAPSAPTLKKPGSSEVIKKSVETITFEWAHNPIDGSAQTSAQLRYSTDGGSNYTTVDITGDSSVYSVDNSFAVNSTVTWSVRTKGVHEDYSPWSENRTFTVRQVPIVSIEQPSTDFVIENTPVSLDIAYSDPSGTLANAKLTIKDGNKTVYERDLGTTLELDIKSSEWLPENGHSYTLSVSVRSTSTLSASAEREVTVDFVLPQPAVLEITPDADTGYVNLVIDLPEEDENHVSAISASVYRVHDGNRLLLADELSAGAGLVDKYAPLNTDYQYEVVTFANSGAANSVLFDSVIYTECAFIYFNGGIVRCEYDPSNSWDIETDVEYVQYVGREYPVVYSSDSTSESHSVSVSLKDREDARTVRKMMMSHEPVIAKLWDELVFHAFPKVSASQDTSSDPFWGTVKIDLTRIDGDAL